MVEPYASWGKQVLYCGDAREIIPQLEIPEDVGWIIDPPWDLDIVLPVGYRKLVFCDGWRQRNVIMQYGAPLWIFTWDCVTSWYTANRPLRRAKYAFWYGTISEYMFNGAFYGHHENRTARFVTNPRSTYFYKPDARGKHLSDIFRYPITQRGKLHSHEKPLDWIRMLIGNCFSSAECVVDPFSGTGTSLQAGKQLDKRVIGIELSEEYCELIAKAMESTQMILPENITPNAVDLAPPVGTQGELQLFNSVGDGSGQEPQGN